MADNNNPNAVNEKVIAQPAIGEKSVPAPEAKQAEASSLPFPHNSLSAVATEGGVYKDLISEAYSEHEAALKTKEDAVYAPDAELLAAREDAQVRLSEELKANLRFQRSIAKEAEVKGGVRVKLLSDHIHAGVAYKAGEEINIDAASADYIVTCGAGKKL